MLAPGSHATFWLLLRSRKCAPKDFFLNQSVFPPSDRVDIFLSSEKLPLLSFINRRKMHNVIFQFFKHVMSEKAHGCPSLALQLNSYISQKIASFLRSHQATPAPRHLTPY